MSDRIDHNDWRNNSMKGLCRFIIAFKIASNYFTL